MPPSCSVVVPVRDDARELRGLLEALALQTRPPLEIIVVDNGSRDDSTEVARTAGCRVVVEPRPGIPAAVAAGYDAARGDLILRCDADTRPPRDWIDAHQVAHVRGGPSAPIVTGPARFRLTPPFDVLASAVYLGGYFLATAAALGHLPAFGTTMSIRRSWWQQVREQVSRSPDVHDDMDLSFRIRPGERILLAWPVQVEMSERALRPGPGMAQRWRRAVATLRRNWHEQTPWDRWAARLSRPGAPGVPGPRALSEPEPESVSASASASEGER